MYGILRRWDHVSAAFTLVTMWLWRNNVLTLTGPLGIGSDSQGFGIVSVYGGITVVIQTYFARALST